MRLTKKVHALLEELLQPGDFAIDATAGNGHDTFKLATLVGREGKVIAIDLQPMAIEATRRRLQEGTHGDAVELVCADHTGFLLALEARSEGQVAAIVFNLGYLPGSDKSVTTRSGATVSALESSVRLLRQGGVLLVTAYRGHPGGQDEADAVARWAEALEKKTFSVCFDEPALRSAASPPPVLWTVRRTLVEDRG